ncbi:TlpA family protein disulfide reductase [Seonamhaeicola marinus]|uniref:TlpA family protein disulfide reductase n=1 Tax=Seonamhaeicola marinus TaxID=1912246 RepID=A0A5D0HLW2_9FLAO|nr:TlpA disulfide reductase family protein [Seonamhaeicola marinus]TYA71980.1 TlpA family protein disulfide reductase [Seonamhaeicola marinus]
MKKLLLIAIAIVLASCKAEPKDYVTLSGKITNKYGDNIVIRTREFSKTIPLNEDGSFSDTLKVKAGVYNLFDGNESTNLFLKNGYNINLTLDTKEFDETIAYTGEGAESSNYLAKKTLLEEASLTPGLLDLEEDKFKAKISEIKVSFSELLNNSKNLDSIIVANENLNLEKMEEGLLAIYNQQKAMASQFEKFVGQPSPTFVNYENYKGGTTSLSDLKGKYVYVDVWATWCGPCKREIPFLKEVEHNYEGKNIEFVSISVDNGRGFKGETQEEKFAASKEGWRKMIADLEMGGTQLFSDKAWESDFVQGFEIRGIPRFILIDPNGNVVNANAPRPSSPKLIELFNELNI